MSLLRRNVIANYLGGAWTALMGILFVPLYIRYLGIEAYGLIGLYVALQAWMLVLDMGFTPSLNREMARLDAGQRSAQSARSLLRSLEFLYLPIAVFSALLIGALAPWMASSWLSYESLNPEEVARALSIMALTVVARWFSTLYRGGIMGLQQQVWLNQVGAAFATLRGAGVLLVLEFVEASLMAYFLFQFAAFILEALVCRRKLMRLLPAASGVAFSWLELGSVARFALGVALINILAGLLTQLDKFVLSAALPLTVLGQYTLASTVAGAMFVAIAPVSNAAFPRFTESHSSGDMETLGRDYRELTQVVAGVIAPIGLFLACFAYPVLSLWTGDPGLAASSAPLLTILALGGVLNGVMTLPYVLQLSTGWTRLALTLNLVAVLAYIPLVYPAIAWQGAMAPALFWLLLNMLYVVISIPLMHRRLLPAERLPWYGWSLFAPLLASAAVCLPLRWLFDQINSVAPLAQSLLMLVTAAAALLLAQCSTPVGRRITRTTLRQLLSARSAAGAEAGS